MTITAQTCFLSPAFTHWWDAVHHAVNGPCWDEGIILDLLVEAYNAGKTPEQALELALEADAELAWEAHYANPFS